MRIRTAILGASGYAGAELTRLLAGHPNFETAVLVAEGRAGEPVGEVYPQLRGVGVSNYQRLDQARASIEKCSLVFAALPHGQSMRYLPGMANQLIVDLSGDFRLHSAENFEQWYGVKHQCPDLLGAWTYGLPELFKEQLRGAKRITNPGCYATAVILALAPLVESGLVDSPLTVSAMSGLSGAGAGLKRELQFCEAAHEVRAYRVGSHQHTPEIEQTLTRCAGGKIVQVSFTPHVVPVLRGILATCSGSLTRAVSLEELLAIFRKRYDDSPFVDVGAVPAGVRAVIGTNRVLIGLHVEDRLQRVWVTCAIDNLIKGAAGQAIQNANLAFGFGEQCGLEGMAVVP